MKKVSIAARLAGVRPAAPDVIAGYACDGPAMLGVIRIPAGSPDHHWERHGCGDEVLYLLAGARCSPRSGLREGAAQSGTRAAEYLLERIRKGQL